MANFNRENLFSPTPLPGRLARGFYHPIIAARHFLRSRSKCEFAEKDKLNYGGIKMGNEFDEIRHKIRFKTQYRDLIADILETIAALPDETYDELQEVELNGLFVEAIVRKMAAIAREIKDIPKYMQQTLLKMLMRFWGTEQSKAGKRSLTFWKLRIEGRLQTMA